MKKNLKTLKLNKKSISKFNEEMQIKGGISGAHYTCNPQPRPTRECQLTDGNPCTWSWINCFLTHNCG